MPESKHSSSSGSPKSASHDAAARVSIIGAVQTPLGFFVLLVLVAEAFFGALAVLLASKASDFVFHVGIIVVGMLLLFFALIGGVIYLSNSGTLTSSRKAPLPPPPSKTLSPKKLEELESSSLLIYGEEKPPPAEDSWFKEFRPVMHQASYYSTPTYYLDVNLKILDWNMAFGLLFSKDIGILRGKHVKFLITRFSNYDDVLEHAQEFTRNVFAGKMPFVDIEPLDYASSNYGDVRMLKVATQLHDSDAELRGWAVALFIREMDWELWEADLLEEFREDKLWSIYSASYDRILCEFPPYSQLIDDVISVVPDRECWVADIGAGTGNVTEALLKKGHRVTAVESNLGMLNRLRARAFPENSVHIVKSSAEHLDALASERFDAVVMVNVLYAIDDPLACLRGIHRILKPDGVLGLSTTHSETQLDLLLDRIKERLEQDGKFDGLKEDYKNLYDSNKLIEQTIVRRYTRDDYRNWLEAAGFEVIESIANTYEQAVTLIHARKISR